MATLTLQPDETAAVDAMISAAYPTYNMGIHAQLVVGGGSSADQPWRSLLKFDLSSIPAGSTINSATLTLYCESSADTGTYTVGVYRALMQWYEGAQNQGEPGAGEDASTWNLRNANGSVAWGAVGGLADTDYDADATDSKSITTAVQAYDFDVAADVAAFVAGTATNLGWWAIMPTYEAYGGTRKRFTSSSGTAANRPKLVVEYTTGVPRHAAYYRRLRA